MKTQQHVFVLLIALSILYGCGPREDSEPRETTFEDLTVPARALPSNCKLAASVGLPFSSAKSSNPTITTEPKLIGFLSMLAHGAELEALHKRDTVPGEETSTEAQKTDKETMAEARRQAKERMAEEATKIKAAYVAGYDDKSQRETVVWALQFNKSEEAKLLFDQLSSVDHGYKHCILKDSILIFAWTDNAEDPSCLNAVYKFLQKD